MTTDKNQRDIVRGKFEKRGKNAKIKVYNGKKKNIKELIDVVRLMFGGEKCVFIYVGTLSLTNDKRWSLYSQLQVRRRQNPLISAVHTSCARLK